jgi:predicted O-linked N-acetylglucosamine transferase (SPINDLY family)
MASRASLDKALGEARAGRIDAALRSVRAIVQRDRNDWEAVQVLAMLLADAGEFTQAIHHFGRVVAVAPNAAPLRNNFANTLLAAGRPREAVEQWRAALAVDPSYLGAYLGLTNALVACGDADAAVAAGREGLAQRPDWPQLEQNLANALEAAMRIDEAVALLRECVARHPRDARVRSRYLQAINYIDLPLADSVAEHRAFRECGEQAAAALAATSPGRARASGAGLRLGILSGDMRTHSVAYFALPLIERRGASVRLTIFSTGHAKEGDALRSRLSGLADEWVDLAAATDSAIAAAMAARDLDVLIELGGHTSGGRLSALTPKPAPLIISAIGYPNSTGHRSVDARIVDSITDPCSEPSQCTEQLLRIDPCFLCYSPPPDAPEPAMPLPAAPITFGSFNLATKISPRCARLWAQVLRSVPESRLLLKSQAIADACARERLLAMLAEAGVARARIDVIEPTATLRDHLGCYARMHIALDTLPYNGTTTTCEALWMGVPVVTLLGDRHAARVGASLLHASSCAEWVAATEAEFVARASALAADIAQLAALRQGLRARVAASTLCDQSAYAARVIAAIESFDAASRSSPRSSL